jgi:hypothetical protein
MNLLQTLFYRQSKPLPDEPVRGLHGQFSESPRTRRTRSLKASVEAQLGVYVARTPRDQRKAEMDAYVARARETEAERFARIERKAFAGMRVSRDGLGKA